jgi:cysteine-S-conjugate beta-lyase
MMNFNELINRLNTDSVKWDSMEQIYGEKDLLPMWVADMDFMTCPAIIEGIKREVAHGVFGYKNPSDRLKEAIADWQENMHGFRPTAGSIVFSPAVVPSICTAIQAYTNEGDAVLIHDPVYTPFAVSIQNNHRKLVRSELVSDNHQYTINFDDVERKMIENDIKLYIFCNPHNPCGRVWKAEELQKVGELCQKYGVILVSDEIHQDIVFGPNKFTSMLNIGKDFSAFTVVFTAPTKTFNLAGAKVSYAFIENAALRERFVEVQTRNCGAELNSFGLTAAEVALKEGKAWLDELLTYFSQNFDIVEEFVAMRLPKVKFNRPEGTYLAWLDFSAYDLTDKEIMNILVHEGKVVLNAGIDYGEKGSKFFRMNIATSKANVVEGLNRIEKALATIHSKHAIMN